MPPRPDRLVVVTGTTTGVGKTWTTAGVMRILRAGSARVSARKPAQSFAVGEGPTDAEVLAAASGEDAADVCPAHRWYPVALAPPMAADALGRPRFVLADLLGELAWPAGCRYGLVETVGGPRSPVAHDADSADLAGALEADEVVLVADAGLGAINAVLLAAPLVAAGRPLVFLNRHNPADPTHAATTKWLRAHTRLRITTDVTALARALSSK